MQCKVSLKTSEFSNIFVATEAVKPLEKFLGHTFNEGIPSIYDKAMDAVYNSTHIGGGHLHRLADGSHTLWGAWDKCQNATSNDSLLEEVSGYFTALGHDMSSSVGLPIASMTTDSYHQLSGWLSNFGINKSWSHDLLHVNTPEFLASSISVLALIFNWNSDDTDSFSQIAGSM